MNKDVLESLVLAHQAGIYRFLRYLGARIQDAEDLTQEAFLAAYRNPRTPVEAEFQQMAGWLRGIARNLFFQHCRRSKRTETWNDTRLLEKAQQVWEKEFLHQGDGYEYVEALRACLDQLPARERRALDLRYRSRKSRDEMSGLLSMTANGVKALLRRVRAGLRGCIRKQISKRVGT